MRQILLATLIAAAAVGVVVAGRGSAQGASAPEPQAQAQGHADFSGTWVLEKVEREGGNRPSMGAPGGRGGFGSGFGGMGGGRRGGTRSGAEGGRGPRPEGGPGMEAEGAIVTITQNADRIIITRQGADGDMVTYALNGSESVNPGPRGGQMKSKAKWDGAGLVVENKVSMDTPRGSLDMKMREVRSISADGETMTVRVTSDTPMGKTTRVMTWRKRDGDR